MSTTPKLSPKEKKLAERHIYNVQILSAHWKVLSKNDRFIWRRQLRALLALLGMPRQEIDSYMHKDALDIINDWKPFKLRRLRKLVNGRRRQ